MDGMKLKYRGWNLIEKIKMNRNSKVDEIYFGLLCYLKRYDIYQLLWAKLHEISKLEK
jgi:hypothetical protein